MVMDQIAADRSAIHQCPGHLACLLGDPGPVWMRRATRETHPCKLTEMGLRDRAYLWTSSVFLMLGNMLV